MSLVHRFSILSEKNSSIITDEIYSVSIPDYIINYMSDSIQWITTKWNGLDSKPGLSYYGYSIISISEIEKLVRILNSWMEIFDNAPNEFFLTGDFSLDKMQNEKILVKKEDIINELKNLKNLCNEALKKRKKILHNGI